MGGATSTAGGSGAWWTRNICATSFSTPGTPRCRPWTPTMLLSPPPTRLSPMPATLSRRALLPRTPLLPAGTNASAHAAVDCRNAENTSCAVQLIVAERGPLLFVFNFSPFDDYEGYKVRARSPRNAAQMRHCLPALTVAFCHASYFGPRRKCALEGMGASCRWALRRPADTKQCSRQMTQSLAALAESTTRRSTSLTRRVHPVRPGHSVVAVCPCSTSGLPVHGNMVGNRSNNTCMLTTRHHAWGAGVPDTNFNDRAFSMLVAAPSRTVAVYALMPETSQKTMPL